MTHESNDSSGREDRLNEILAEYFQAVETNEKLDQEAFIARHPDFAAELEEFFAHKERFDQFAGQFRPADLVEEPTIDSGASSTPPPGTRVRYFGDYELLGEIGRGGMGVVFKARQVSLNRIVALKMILTGQLASEADVKRFHMEAEAAAKLDHPGIVPVHEVGEYEGQHYFAMAYVESQTLAAKLASGPLPASEAAELTREVANAVAYAHGQGVLHRDLKPTNVLLDSVGQPRITDFGLAKRVEGDSKLTATGQVLGTPSYIPPEQAAGKLDQIKETADLYSLGAVLYALLTGRPPFQADNPLDTLTQVVEQEPVSPRQLNDKVPRDLETICLKCLDKERHRRYSSTQQLVDDLTRFVTGEPIRARPVHAWERTLKWAKRRPTIAALSATIIVLTAVGLGIVTWQWQRASNAFDTAETNLYLNRIALAPHERLAGDLDRGDQLLDECKPKFRHWEWHYLKRLCHPLLLRVRGHSDEPTAVAFSCDGRRVATASIDKNVRLWDVTTGEEVLKLQHRHPVWCVAFSPDGRHLATASGEIPESSARRRRTDKDTMNGMVTIWDLTTGEKVRERSGHAGQRNSIAFSPDGKRLASPSHGNTVVIWDPLTGQAIATLPGHSSRRFGWRCTVAFSPDGKRLALGRGKGDTMHPVKVVEIATGEEVISLGSGGVCVAFSPDGKRLATAAGLWDVMTGEQVFPFADQRLRDKSVAFSPDGRRVVTTQNWTAHYRSARQASTGAEKRPTGHSLEPRIKIFDTANGQELVTIDVPLNEPVEAVAFSPDGSRIASVCALRGSRTPEGAQLDIWDGEAGREALALGRNSLPVTDVSFSRDGRYVAGVSRFARNKYRDHRPGSPGETRIWDTDTGRMVLSLTPDRDLKLSVAVSSDGQRIAAASSSHAAIIWDAVTGEKLLTLRGHTGTVRSVAFCPDAKRVATASDGKTVKVWDGLSGKELLSLQGHQVVPTHVTFNHDGKILASASGCIFNEGGGAGYGGRSETKLWDAATGRELRTLDTGYGLSFSPDGKRLATGSYQGTVAVWDTKSGKELATFREGTGSPEHMQMDQMAEKLSNASGKRDATACVFWSRDGRTIVSAGGLSKASQTHFTACNIVSVWDADNQTELRNFTWGTSGGGGSGMALSPDGQRFASANLYGDVTVHDLSGDGEIINLEGHHRGVHSIAWFPDGNRLATASVDHSVRVWDVGAGSEILALYDKGEAAHDVAWSPDGQRLASASWDRTVRVWDIGTARKALALRGHQDLIYEVTFSPDGRRIASASADKTARVWDAATGQTLLTLSGHEGAVSTVGWRADSRRLATAGPDGSIKIWDADTGKEIRTMDEDRDSSPVYGTKRLAWCPEGELLASTCGGSGMSGVNWDFRTGPVAVWDTVTGKQAVTWRDHGPTRGFKWTPDGKHFAGTMGARDVLTELLATGREQTTEVYSTYAAIALWDVASGRPRPMARTGRAHMGGTCDLAFSPDGKRLVSASSDRTMKLWDTATGQEIITLRGYADWVMDATFSHDGKRIAAGCRDGTVKVYDGTPLEERMRRMPRVP